MRKEERGELLQMRMHKGLPQSLQRRVQINTQSNRQGDVAKLKLVRSLAAIVGSVALLSSVAACSSDSQGDLSAEDSAASNTQAKNGDGAQNSDDSADASRGGASSSKTNNTDMPSREALARRNIPADERMKIASLLMVGVDSFDDALAKLKQGVGGIFITSWADPALLTEEGRNIHALRNLIKRPFAVAVDFEGGSVQRHRQVLGDFPSARKMAERMAPEQAREQGYRIGRSLIARGITTDFAPVLDVDSSTTDVVGDRAFSDNPQVVADYAGQFAAGLKDAGVTPVFKHFPGHGAANGDTHKGAAVTPPLEQMEKRDLVPYAQLLKASAEGGAAEGGAEGGAAEGGAPENPSAASSTPGDVMVGHIIVPGLGDQNLPGTLNPAAYDLLRSGAYPGGSPYNGTIYTDDISGMKAVTDVTTPPDAAARAIAAGADQVLWSTDVPIDAVIEAVQAKLADGSLSTERFEDALLHSQLRFIPEFPEIPRAEKQDLATVSVAPKPATPAPVQPSPDDAPVPAPAQAPAAAPEQAPAAAPEQAPAAAPAEAPPQASEQVPASEQTPAAEQGGSAERKEEAFAQVAGQPAEQGAGEGTGQEGDRELSPSQAGWQPGGQVSQTGDQAGGQTDGQVGGQAGG